MMDNEQIKKEQEEALREAAKGTEKQMYPDDQFKKGTGDIPSSSGENLKETIEEAMEKAKKGLKEDDQSKPLKQSKKKSKKVDSPRKRTTYPELLAELKSKTLNIMRRDKDGKFNKYNMNILEHIKAIEHELLVIKRKK